MLERLHTEITDLGGPGQTLFGSVLTDKTLHEDCAADLAEVDHQPLLRAFAVDVVKGRSQTASSYLPDVLRNLEGLTNFKVTMRMPQLLGSDWTVFAPSVGTTLRELHLTNQALWTLWALSTALKTCEKLTLENCLGSAPIGGAGDSWHLPRDTSWDLTVSPAPLTHLFIKTSPTFFQEWTYVPQEVDRFFRAFFKLREPNRHPPGAMEVDEYDDDDWGDIDLVGSVPLGDVAGADDWTLQEVRALDKRSNQFLVQKQRAVVGRSRSSSFTYRTCVR